MSNAGWYANRLRQMLPQQAPPPQQPTQPTQPPWSPAMHGGYPQAQQFQQPYQPVPGTEGNALAVGPQPTSTYEAVQRVNMAINSGQYRGSKQVNNNSSVCPNCHGGNYFNRSASEGPSRLPPPAPQCYDCGYTGGLFTQGDEANWVSASTS